MKARIRVRPVNEFNCHNLLDKDGKWITGIHISEVKEMESLAERIAYLERIGCQFTADKLKQAVRLS